MNRFKKWFVRSEIFADICLFLSFISIIGIIPIKDENVVPFMIFIWLLLSIFNDIKGQKKNNI